MTQKPKLKDVGEFVQGLALKAGYEEKDFNSGMEFYKRKNRLTDPPGNFDSAGRWFSSEETDSIGSSRYPSRAWPYSQLKTARTAKHCAEVAGVPPLHTKRIGKALEFATAQKLESFHEAIDLSRMLKNVLKKPEPAVKKQKQSSRGEER